MKSSSSGPIDMRPYLKLLREADESFRTDVSYAVAISKAARTISWKRELWKLRLELRQASDKAQTKCANEKPFKCDNLSPCGVGDCKFAEGDLIFLDVPNCPGNTKRPQKDSKGLFGLESAVEPLRDLRAH